MSKFVELTDWDAGPVEPPQKIMVNLDYVTCLQWNTDHTVLIMASGNRNWRVTETPEDIFIHARRFHL